MGFNVSLTTAYEYENAEMLRNAAKNILNRQKASPEATQKVIEKTLFNNDMQMKELYTNSQLTALKAATQVTLSNSLKETIKYLGLQKDKKAKKEPVLGEIWELFSASSSEEEYKGELYDFKIDENAKNIFAA